MTYKKLFSEFFFVTQDPKEFFKSLYLKYQVIIFLHYKPWFLLFWLRNPFLRLCLSYVFVRLFSFQHSVPYMGKYSFQDGRRNPRETISDFALGQSSPISRKQFVRKTKNSSVSHLIISTTFIHLMPSNAAKDFDN